MENLLEYLKVISALWNHKVFTIQDVKLSLGNILLALLLLGLANRLSKLTARLIMKRLVEPFEPDRTAINTYRRLVYTCTLAIFVVIALSVAGIPLTIFTVVGGALAIGVGFGSQNIVNNFISGLILMAERPIKVGDTIEINGISGTVVEIGTRATRIRTAENKLWIVPNSQFLENPVLNWHDRGAIVRGEVNVGVSYQCEPEQLKELCLKIMQDMSFVEKSPSPRVLLQDFGDSTLNFKLYYWADTDKVESLQQCSSEIRFALDKVLRTHNIEISYPQRDLHLKTSVPLEVKLKS